GPDYQRGRRWRREVCRRIRSFERTRCRGAQPHRRRRSSPRRKPRMRPRPEHRGAVVGRSLTYPWRLQRPVQYGRSFHECDDIKQYDQRSKRKRNRDRPCPPGALLFLTENDSLWLLLHVITLSSVAFLTHHARIDQQHREQDE